MEPLRRWPTPHSIHSWWSDSNPPGATVSLHTLAKPILKQLYHRQAVGIIAARADFPLSNDTVEMLMPYLMFKHIFASTRAVVIGYLSLRAGKTEEEARIIVDGNILACTHELLQSSDPDLLRLVCNMLENIAGYKSLRDAVADLGADKHLIALFSHRNIHVQTAAVEALDRILSDTQANIVQATVKWWMPYRNRLDGRWPYGIKVTTVRVEDTPGEEIP